MTTTQSVYDAFEADIRRWFSRRVSAEAVDDLVQESFLRIHRGLPALEQTDRLGPWVYRICRSVWIDAHRRKQPDGEAVDELADPDGFAWPAELDANAVVAGWLPAFVDALPETYREAVRLSELEGLSQKEVAQRLGISASGARSRVQRGRKLVRQALDDCCRVTLEAGEVVDVRPNQCGCEAC